MDQYIETGQIKLLRVSRHHQTTLDPIKMETSFVLQTFVHEIGKKVTDTGTNTLHRQRSSSSSSSSPSLYRCYGARPRKVFCLLFHFRSNLLPLIVHAIHLFFIMPRIKCNKRQRFCSRSRLNGAVSVRATVGTSVDRLEIELDRLAPRLKIQEEKVNNGR